KMQGPIGMSEEKDSAQMAAEQAMFDAGHHAGGVEDISGVPPQMQPTPGVPTRMGAVRRKDRVMEIMHRLPDAAQQSIIESLSPEEQRHYGVSRSGPARHAAVFTANATAYQPAQGDLR
ncbi:ABC transporter ATP-binding protein, partial [Amycolatopsis sp. NPDC049691]